MENTKLLNMKVKCEILTRLLLAEDELGRVLHARRRLRQRFGLRSDIRNSKKEYTSIKCEKIKRSVI